jgi:hypothetical protein
MKTALFEPAQRALLGAVDGVLATTVAVRMSFVSGAPFRR